MLGRILMRLVMLMSVGMKRREHGIGCLTLVRSDADSTKGTIQVEMVCPHYVEARNIALFDFIFDFLNLRVDCCTCRQK